MNEWFFMKGMPAVSTKDPLVEVEGSAGCLEERQPFQINPLLETQRVLCVKNSDKFHTST